MKQSNINQNSANAVVINTPLKLDVSTTLGGTGSGLVVISNVIAGSWHSLTLTNSGTWRICGLTPNTYSGGTIIKRGTLIWGAITNGASPDCSYALGSGPVTLYSGASLQFEHASLANTLTLNGGTLYAANSAVVTWIGPVTVNSNTTLCTDYGMEISGNLSGAGGLTKTGTNTLTLSGVNSYTGVTLVQTGMVTCPAPTSLGGGALSISNGAVVNLNYSGTRNIFSLTLGGANKLAGVYGSSNSPATYQDAHFTGTGTVTVPVPMSITNLPATGIATNQAKLNARLGLTLAYGGTNATVLAYWGTVNGGTNPAAWSNSAIVGKWTNIFSTNISYADGSKVGEDTTAPCSFAWSNAFAGVHSLYAGAIDAGGRQLTSAVAHVTLTRAMSNTFVPAGAVWRYFDKTNDLGANWRSNAFSDVTWSNGPARLGFGNDSEVTKVASNKQWTTYFRRTLYVPDPALVQTLAGRLTRDDGAVLYLNGAEIWRDSNLPAGVISNQTPALTSIAGETNWLAFNLAPSTLALLTPGRNLFAAEVHQSALTSSDLGFDLELTGTVNLAERPELHAILAGSSLVLTAPADAVWFTLFSSTNLTPLVNWIPATNTAVLTNNQWRVTMPAATNRQRFFRLQTP